jgi:nucleoside-diphosphate-sugar epimerase
MPRKEDMLPMPKSPYAVSKLTGEYYMGAFNKCYDIDTCSLRYFNVFGPRQNPKSQYAAVIPKFITAAIKEEPITVYGDGLQSRDFSFIDNNIDANLRVLESQKDLKGEVINIACNKQYTLLDMIRDIEEIVEHRLNVKFEDARRGDVKHSLADIAKAETLLGYKSKVEFKEGLIRTFEYYKGCADGEGT